ncbi:MAG: glycosyltransferase family 4 protein [bacterium]|nr:glycosyltransferase family 4 protein [bacterium]
MNICIDAGMGLISREKGGIYYLIPQFLDALYKVAPENQYIIYGYFIRKYHSRIKHIKEILTSDKFHFRFLPLPSKIVEITEQKIKFPLIELFLSKNPISVYHGFCGGYLPCFKKIKTVYTVYDLSFEINPGFYQDKWYKYIKDSALRADIIITPSLSTKNDLIRVYDIPDNKIRVTHLGINTSIFKPIEKEIARQFLKKHFPFEKYILTVATSIKRKNLPFLLDVYKMLKEKKIEEKLVIIAGTDYLKNDILKISIDRKIEQDVFCLTEIPVENMPYFYAGAELFLFLSLYEGFGLPALEAMSCGCPVVVSNVSSLPEIVADAGITVSPYDKEEACNKIIEILNNDTIKSAMIKKGLERSKIFSWEKCAKETLEVYKSLVT